MESAVGTWAGDLVHWPKVVRAFTCFPILFHDQNTFACLKNRALSSDLVIQKHYHLDRFSGDCANSEMGTLKRTEVMKVKILVYLLAEAF